MTYVPRSGEPVQALEEANLEVEEGEFVSLVGPSGCGKTTLLRIVGGLLQATGGVVRIGDEVIVRPSTDVGMVFQSPVLLPWRTVTKNVLLPIEVLGKDVKAAKGRAQDLLELVGLVGFENKLPRELSGGMRQRASIARALVYDPAILLMDEPFGALDAFTRETMNDELLQIWEKDRKTVVFVTHSIQEAVYLSDRIIVMGTKPGRVVADVRVTLPRPRSLEQLATEEAASMMGEVRGMLRGADEE